MKLTKYDLVNIKSTIDGLSFKKAEAFLKEKWGEPEEKSICGYDVIVWEPCEGAEAYIVKYNTKSVTLVINTSGME